MEKKPKQLHKSPTNSLIAVTKKELGQLSYSHEAGSQLLCKIPESLLSAKYGEVGPCGLTTNHIHNTYQENLVGIPKQKQPIEKKTL